MSELSGAELDLAVAEKLGHVDITTLIDVDKKPYKVLLGCINKTHFSPTENAEQAFPIIDDHDIALMKFRYRDGVHCEPFWVASYTNPYDSVHYAHHVEGTTLLEAAMRAVVEKEIQND